MAHGKLGPCGRLQHGRAGSRYIYVLRHGHHVFRACNFGTRSNIEIHGFQGEVMNHIYINHNLPSGFAATQFTPLLSSRTEPFQSEVKIDGALFEQYPTDT